MRRGRLSEESLIAIAARFKALGELNRLRIVEALKSGEKSVSGLVEDTALAQSNVSQHLKVLLVAGLIEKRRKGTSFLYALADRSLIEVCDLVCRSVTKRLY